MRPFLTTLVPLMLLTATACSTEQPGRRGGEEHQRFSKLDPDTEFATATLRDVETIHRTTGTVRGRATAVLASRILGYVTSIAVEPGATVREGQVLATLEAADIAAQVASAGASLSRSVAAQAEARSALDASLIEEASAKLTFRRMEALWGAGATAKQPRDDAESAWRGAAARVTMANARVKLASAGISEARAGVMAANATLGYSKITAPFAGRVIERRVDIGTLATPGAPLLVVELEGKLRVEAPMEESRAGEVAIGDAVQVELHGTQGPIDGKVAEIVPSVDTASRAFLVKVDLPAEAPGARPGMFARVGFRFGTSRKLLVPTRAIQRLGALDRVFVIEGGAARARLVTRGSAYGEETEVLSGLSPDERIVAQPTGATIDGARLAVAL